MIVLILLATCFVFPALAAEPVENDPPATKTEAAAGPFAEAVDYAQRRCVKILGAGIGREPGYASGIIISAEGQILTAQGIYLSMSSAVVDKPSCAGCA
jgi:hypothetical protein